MKRVREVAVEETSEVGSSLVSGEVCCSQRASRGQQNPPGRDFALTVPRLRPALTGMGLVQWGFPQRPAWKCAGGAPRLRIGLCFRIRSLFLVPNYQARTVGEGRMLLCVQSNGTPITKFCCRTACVGSPGNKAPKSGWRQRWQIRRRLSGPVRASEWPLVRSIIAIHEQAVNTGDPLPTVALSLAT